MANEMKFCSNCGEKQPKDQEVCSNCGYAFVAKESSETSENKKTVAPKKNRKGLGIGVLVALLVLIGVGVYFFRDSFIDALSNEESIAGTYRAEDVNPEVSDQLIVIDEDNYTQFIMTDFMEDETVTQIINFYMKEEKENLYVVDFAEGYIIELKYEADPELLAEGVREFEEEVASDDYLNDLFASIENKGDHVSIKTRLLSNADLWEYDLFYGEEFNLEKVGENLKAAEGEVLLLKQPSGETEANN